MRHIILALATVVLLTGCATTAGQNVLAKTDIGPDTVKILTDLKAAIQPLLATVAQDAVATRTWADKVLGPAGSNPDPVKYQLAYACPRATDAVGGLITGTIDGMIAQVTALTAPPDANAPKGFLMLTLTQLKYGTQPDPKAQLAALKSQFALQRDLLFTGCMHLLPVKQMNDVMVLGAKAGIVGFSGGALAPIMGF